MHKSRLAGFIIDCKTNDLDSAGQFWSQALGYPLKQSKAAEAAKGGEVSVLDGEKTGEARDGGLSGETVIVERGFQRVGDGGRLI